MKILILALLVVVGASLPIEDVRDLSPNDVISVLVNGVPEGEAIDLSDVVHLQLNEIHPLGVESTNLLEPLSQLPEVAIVDETIEAIAVGDAQEAIILPAEVFLPEQESEIVDVVAVESPQEAIILPAEVILPEQETEIVDIGVVESPQEAIILPAEVILPGQESETVDAIAVGSPQEAVILPIEVFLPEQEVIIPEQAVILPAEVIIAAPENEQAQEAVALPAEITPVETEIEAVETENSILNGEIFNNGLVTVTINGASNLYNTVSSWVSLAVNYFTADGYVTKEII